MDEDGTQGIAVKGATASMSGKGKQPRVAEAIRGSSHYLLVIAASH